MLEVRQRSVEIASMGGTKASVSHPSAMLAIAKTQLTELIENAPWREAVTYRDTWPHEYVLSEKDDQRELLAAICARFHAGEGVAGRFFRMTNTYLFVGDYKYWLMTDYRKIDPLAGEDNYVINRALLYRDRRDFVIQPGDTGRLGDYPASPAAQPIDRERAAH